MENDFSLVPMQIQQLAVAQELRACNEFTASFGMRLAESQIQLLLERRVTVLKETGRMEFGSGILKKLVYAFCDSPYLSQQTYEDTLVELQDSFYYFKNESHDRLADDELIGMMRQFFDGKAQGSLDYLSGTSLEDLCRAVRHGSAGEAQDERI